MPSLEVISVAPALAAAAGLSLERAVPRIVLFHIGYHVLRLIVPAQTVPTIFLPIDRYDWSRGCLRAEAYLVVLVANEDEAALFAQMAKCYLEDHRRLQVLELSYCPLVELHEPRVEILHIHYN